MPDAGGFETGVPDNNAPHGANIGWGEAFAALPQETPDAGGWQRLHARLPAPARARTRWPLWLATAASLLLAVAIPLRMLRQAGPDAAMPQAAAAPASTQPAVATTAPMVAAAVAVDARGPVSMPAANRSQPRRSARAVPSQRPIRTVAQPADATRLANAGASSTTDLEPLYAQSAQLEDLLALARDDRVASGTTAALSDELDAQLASIDTALIQPGLSDAQRAGLWSRRVDALQQLVGIEATNRLYAARGQHYDAALVSID